MEQEKKQRNYKSGPKKQFNHAFYLQLDKDAWEKFKNVCYQFDTTPTAAIRDYIENRTINNAKSKDMDLEKFLENRQ